MLDRLEKIVGEYNIEKLKNTTVLIIGLGGVGGHALESIVRSGIGKVIIVDNDIVDITNLNRQLITNKTNIGLNKVDVAEKHIKNISNAEIIKINKFIDKNNIKELFEYKIDYIIDACDTVETKYLLIEEALKRNIKIISSMGTAKKTHPELLKIMDLRKTSYDPLAKLLRKKLKNKKVMVVSSIEKAKCKELGSTALVPCVSGILCASYVINDIVGELNET